LLQFLLFFEEPFRLSSLGFLLASSWLPPWPGKNNPTLVIIRTKLRKRWQRELLYKIKSEIRDLTGALRGDFYMERDWCPLVGDGCAAFGNCKKVSIRTM
jgi:hypothetical protein